MAVRILLGIVGFLLLILAMRGVWGSFDPILISLLIVPALTAAALCIWYAAKAGDPQIKQRILCAFKIGFVAGLIAFGLFFVGPLVIMPDANQGPFLGFLAAPPGFALGAILGICFPGLCNRFKSWSISV
jgi:hypothetical protein